MPRLARVELWLLSACGALWLACANAVPFGHYVDDVVWALLSRSMLHGSLRADWSWYPRLETSATWGFAFLLTPASLFASALALKLWSSWLAFVGLTLFWFSVREELDLQARAALLVVLFADGLLLSFSGAVLSEAGYFFLFGVGCLAARPATAGLLSGALLLTRLVGAAFAGAVCLTQPRKKDAAVFAACAAVVVAPYLLLNKWAAGSYTYHAAGWAFAGGHALISNAWYYAKGTALLTSIYFPAFWPNRPFAKGFAVFVVWGLALAGAVKTGKRLNLYAAFYAAICLAWPYQAPRFILPLLPVFGLWLVKGAGRWAPALAALCFFSNVGQIRATLNDSWRGPVEVSHAGETWLKDHAASGDLVVSMDVARLRWFAGLRGVHFLAAPTPEAFAAQARAAGAKWFFTREAGYVALAGGVDPVRAQQERLDAYLARADLFTLVHEERADGARVYALAKSASKK